MYSASYHVAIAAAAERAPTLPTLLPSGTSNHFFAWAEDFAAVLSEIYHKGYDEVLEDLIAEIKAVQDEDSEDSEDSEYS